MIISHTHRAIFVHIPKTAGTSITALIEPTLRWNDLVLGATPFGEAVEPAYRKRFGLSKHMRARDVRRIVGEETWAASFTFAFVRHHYTRLVSFYQLETGAVSRAAADSPLWTWPATEAYRPSAGFTRFIRHRKFLESRVSWPQADWVCDEDGRCIVDFVGRFEELEAALETVAARLGLPSGVLGVHDASESDRPLAECFGGEDDDRYVHDLNRRDLERFGYDPALRP